MGSALFKDLREAKTEADFDALKDRILPEHYYGDIFSCISTPEVLDAYLRHRHLTGNELINAFYTVMRQERIDLMEVFFSGGYLTMQDLLQPDTPSFVVNVTNYVLYKGIVDVMKFFLDKGMSPDLAGGFTQKSILFTACSSCTIDIVSLLLLRGANANFKDMHDYTPLFSAINKPNVRILDNLIMYGADLYYRRDGNNVWNYVSIHIYHEEAMKENFQRLVEFDVPVSKKTYREVERHIHGLPGLPMLLSMMQKVIDKIGFYEDDTEDDAVEESVSEDHATREE